MRKFFEPFVWCWREWPRTCSFLLGMTLTASFAMVVMLLVLAQLLAAVSTTGHLR